jgi:glyoxylase-like metal-dependent hydrolase (beta-lactamase superfamily II)
MSRRLILAWMSAVAVLALPGSIQRVYTQGAQGANSQGPRPAWAWKPAIPTANDGQVHVLPVRGKVFMLVGAGGNITVQAGDDGVLIVDAGAASMSDKVLAAVRTISRGPIRYIVNTDEREEFTGGNDKLAAAGSTIHFRIATDPRVSDALTKDRASVISYVTVFQRMSAPTGKTAPRAEDAWPDDTYSTPQKKLYFNDERILIIHNPANTDGNSIVHFRTDDVVSVGDLLDLTGYPFIDLNAGGSVQQVIEGLNHLLDITVPNRKSEGGTLVIPGHGRLADQPDVAYYREMVAIIRDRIQDGIKRGLTLAQVKAERPTLDYDPRFGKTTGPWTTDMFIEAVYRSLGAK